MLQAHFKNDDARAKCLDKYEAGEQYLGRFFPASCRIRAFTAWPRAFVSSTKEIRLCPISRTVSLSLELFPEPKLY
jgi:hypothetical protein